jgi:uncharacterized protein YndB with AHSA1/START domain
VYKAWTTPELVKRWWHANRGKMTIAEIDLRVGGMWRYVSLTPDAFQAGFHGEYREIVPKNGSSRPRSTRASPTPKSTQRWTPSRSPRWTDGRPSRSSRHPTKEGRDAHINSGMEAGMQDAMDLLEQIAISLR